MLCFVFGVFPKLTQAISPDFTASMTIQLNKALVGALMLSMARGADASGLTGRPVSPNGLCTDDWDCSLNGKCDSARRHCICHSPWTGAHCSQFIIAPSPPGGAGIYGVSPNVSSWGGSVIQWSDGKFHLFVAEMADGCGMVEWDTNSFVRHAVSDTINGTYVKQDIAAVYWAHNPQVIEFEGDLYLFHIGNASGSTVRHCNSEDPLAAHGSIAGAQQMNRRRFDPHAAVIETAKSPFGPWTRLPDGPLCDNPSPWVMANGTLLMMCSRSVGSAAGKSGPHWRLYSAPSPRGPWTHVNEIYPDVNVTDHGTEDPFLWQDPSGNFHALAHGGPPGGASAQPSHKCAQHAFSRDGITWGWSPEPPYSSTINYTDGSSFSFASAERPKLVLDSVGNPTHLINARGTHPWPCNGCPFKNYTNVCNKCKRTPGIAYTNTIMRTLG
eukprot:m.212904 g.212904  ORF g.212904 m.212904 type:complete len:440 (+) comp15507_c0_seq2:412-1731(+)